MGLSYKQSSVPSTLPEGEFAVVDGTTYVGNSSNEPVLVKGYRELSGTLLMPSEQLIIHTNDFDANFTVALTTKDLINIEASNQDLDFYTNKSVGFGTGFNEPMATAFNGVKEDNTGSAYILGFLFNASQADWFTDGAYFSFTCKIYY